MFYRGPGILAVVWFSYCTPTSPVSKFDRRHTGRLRKRNLATRRGGGCGGGAWSSINHSIISGPNTSSLGILLVSKWIGSRPSQNGKHKVNWAGTRKSKAEAETMNVQFRWGLFLNIILASSQNWGFHIECYITKQFQTTFAQGEEYKTLVPITTMNSASGFKEHIQYITVQSAQCVSISERQKPKNKVRE